MRPLNFDHPVLDDEGNIHTLEEYCKGESGDISEAIPSFTSDDLIDNPSEKVSMPLFKDGNQMKDLLRWISKAFQNIRFLLKKTETISDDLDTTLERIEDINSNLVKAWTDTTVAVAGEYYSDEGIIWKCLITNSHKPSEGSDWTAVKVMDEVSELKQSLSNIFKPNRTVNDTVFTVGDYDYLFRLYLASSGTKMELYKAPKGTESYSQVWKVV